MSRPATLPLCRIALPALFAVLLSPLNVHAAKESIVLVVGDSISAEYGLGNAKGWVSLLTARLRPTSLQRVVNASISGDTTAGRSPARAAFAAQARGLSSWAATTRCAAARSQPRAPISTTW
jgi:hypothetical protein